MSLYQDAVAVVSEIQRQHLQDWDIRIKVVAEPTARRGHAGAIDYDLAFRHATIAISVDWEKRASGCSLAEVLAHELGHIVSGSVLDMQPKELYDQLTNADEELASKIGGLLLGRKLSL